MANREYKIEDRILPLLGAHHRLPDPCPIRVVIDRRFVRLFVGPRDWQWEKATGKLFASGTDVETASHVGATRRVARIKAARKRK
jgi:hypothetical protein